MAIAELDLQRIAVLDDDQNEAEGLAVQLEDMGFSAEIVAPPTATLEDMVSAMMSAGDAAVCDHALRKGLPGLEFEGAQVAAELNRRDRPTLLFTSFPMEAAVGIRPYRPFIPVLLGRDEAQEASRLSAGLIACVRELRLGRPEARRTRRVPITIERVRRIDDDWVAEAFIGGWRHEEAVLFPAWLLKPPWGGDNAPEAAGKIFFAKANVGAERADDLFFEDFEPDPAPEGLSPDSLFEPPSPATA